MNGCFSFSYFCCCYLCLLLIVSLFHSCMSNKNIDDDNILCIDRERLALLRFKHSLVDEAGRLDSWVDGKESNCCGWAGIGCDNITGHVQHIHLPAPDAYCHDDYTTAKEYKEASKQTLRGNLSSSLLNLKQLTHLDLSCNDFGGIQVPEFIGSLSNLRFLNLSRSNFSGMIPPQLGNLSELHVLCLGSFYRPLETTSMMNMHWLSSIRRLHHLDISGVDLSEASNWLQLINTLPSLVELHMSYCHLSDIHPHISSLNLTSLSILDLSANYFGSSFPRWIFSITSLVSLDISDCGFYRLNSSKVSFRNLTSLESLNLRGNTFMNSSLALKGLSSVGGNLLSLDISYCGVSSSVLESLYNLTSLLSLDLSNNLLTKRIPKSLGYNLCYLRDLDLSRNDFSNISLTSLLESVFKCKSPHLESLILSDLKLSGTIPDSIGRLSFLWSLDLRANLISGHIPSSIGRLSSLEELYLSDNQLNGVLPYSLGQLSSLKKLYLSQNRITGTIPDSLGRLSSLEKLVLSYNRLNGSLPTNLGQLSKLEELRFSSNLLTGVVTEAHFANLVSLKQLYGGENNLTLRPLLANWIPSFLLVGLNLNSWDLGPQFPMWLQSQKDLSDLNISYTGISSPLPPESFWRSLPSLTFLDMSHNHIQGTLTLLDTPATIELLDVSHNELTGELSPISQFSFPAILVLSHNFFEGSLHDLLCSNGVQRTEGLCLENNQFSSVIPECWDKWPLLRVLDLKNNNLSGGIPTTLGFSSQLRSLNLRGNKLSGKLPSSLMNLTGLEILQLGRNELEGSIPSWFGTELSRLRLLNLRYNSFDGNIPHKLCYLKNIQILDLAHNKLSGNIPKCFNNYSVLTGNETIAYGIISTEISYRPVMGSDSLVMKGREDTYSSFLGLVTLLDLSSNNLVGNIPSELIALRGLKTLNLSRNQLTGRIPEKIGDMRSLETFDLSLNMFFGELPVSLSQLNFLNSFSVSSNNLTGRVPSSTQLQSFSESSFFGNKLCGPPLTKSCAVEVEVPETNDEKEDDGADWGLIISGVLGFVSSFWIVLGSLIVSRSWRITYFGLLNKLRYMVYDGMHKYCFNVFCK